MKVKHLSLSLLLLAIIICVPYKLLVSVPNQPEIKSDPITLPKIEHPVINKIDQLTAHSATIYDFNAQQFIYSHNATAKEYSASTSKLMAMYVIYQRMAINKHLKWSDKIKITNDGISRLSMTPGIGEVRLDIGKSYSAKQLAENAMVLSSNESITALGIWAYGSNTAMIETMNKTAIKLNMHQTHYYSTSGLDVNDLVPFGLQLPGAPIEGKNTASAYDLTLLAQALITRYPQILTLSAQPTVKIDGKIHQATNRYLKGFEYYDPKHGIDGLKTGTTPDAGAVFVGTSILPGKHRIITVVMHADNRFLDTNKLLAAIGR